MRDHFGVDLQERLIGKSLERWGFTPQRPVKRALEQNPEAVRQWLEQDYPRLRAQAAQEGTPASINTRADPVMYAYATIRCRLHVNNEYRLYSQKLTARLFSRY
ncbi:MULTISPECIES: helix-turn-helix domain-containing protein [Acidithiobacillus]|uniref:helix-turn-helix domain-containing protein n=1 Tax=Acidithiobacillus TaxID=119977 RepID=UPI00352E4129